MCGAAVLDANRNPSIDGSVDRERDDGSEAGVEFEVAVGRGPLSVVAVRADMSHCCGEQLQGF